MMKYFILGMALFSFLGISASREVLAQACYQTTIMKPSPFMGNHDEVFQTAEGNYWKVQYEYEYLYEYYPSVTICPAKGKLIVANKSLNIILVSNASSPKGSIKRSGCYETFLKSKSDSGDFLVTADDHVYEVLPGDNIDSMLWLSTSDLLICGPKTISYKGKKYYLWEITNMDDKEKVTAQRVK